MNAGLSRELIAGEPVYKLSVQPIHNTGQPPRRTQLSRDPAFEKQPYHLERYALGDERRMMFALEDLAAKPVGKPG